MARLGQQHLLMTTLALVLTGFQPCQTSGFPYLDQIRPSASVAVQRSAVEGLIQRLVPSHARRFSVHIEPLIGPAHRDTFKLVTISNQVHVTGTTGVAAAWGFHFYLTQHCDCHVSWAGDQLHLPEMLPVITTPITVTSNDRFNYYANVCTVSYSFAWWNWTRWEREIDWMAMKGINLALAFTAQEAVWQRVYLKMGLTQAELDNHFGGVAFLAWSRMSNMHGWAGPLPDSWHRQKVALQHRILERMRAFGMMPILPAFAGGVPNGIMRVFPKANVSKLADWEHFPQKYCCTLLLDVHDPLFPVLGKAFLDEYISEFGTDHVYNTDTFNEMDPKSKDLGYLAASAKAVYQALIAADPQAIWVMMSWTFFNDAYWWHKPQAKAYLTAVPTGRMLILDLFAEIGPQYRRLDSFFGHPFIWCMLHNFGGTPAWYGVVDTINTGPMAGRMYPNSSMVGTGLAPEGINQNDVIYEFMLENTWRTQPRDVSTWMMDYTRKRYGRYSPPAAKAWRIFGTGIYNCTDGHHDFSTDVIPVRRPSLNMNPWVWFDVEEFFTGWDQMISAAGSLHDSALYRYDLVDVTRQVLQTVSILFHQQLVAGYSSRNITQMIVSGQSLLDLITDMDGLLATNRHFLLGNWVEDAKAVATTTRERTLYEYNARIVLTIWGPEGNLLDYANRQWSGLLRDYYRPRWELFILRLTEAMLNNQPFDEKAFGMEVFQNVEWPFANRTNVYPTYTTGDPIAASRMIYTKYRPIARQEDVFFRLLPARIRKPSQDSWESRKQRYKRPSGL